MWREERDGTDFFETNQAGPTDRFLVIRDRADTVSGTVGKSPDRTLDNDLVFCKFLCDFANSFLLGCVIPQVVKTPAIRIVTPCKYGTYPFGVFFTERCFSGETLQMEKVGGHVAANLVHRACRFTGANVERLACPRLPGSGHARI